MHARHHAYIYIYNGSSGNFFLLVLLSIEDISFYGLIHSFHSFLVLKLIDRLSYLQVRNQILTFSEISILLFHSSLELVRSFLLPSSFFFLLLLLLAFLSFSFLSSDLPFDTNIIHCFKKTRSDI